MHIDSYQFGLIILDEITYDSDCLIAGKTVHPNWWRKQGHLLSADDLQSVIKAMPSILIVGCGASGFMKISNDARQILQRHSIKVEVLNTGQAVNRFNELSQAGENVAAALHLTC